MSDDEKLKEYIRENTPTQRTEIHTPPPPQTPRKPHTKSPLSWYVVRVIIDFIFKTFYGMMIGLMAYTVIYTVDQGIAGPAGIGVMVLLFVANIVWTMYRYGRYTSWLRGVYYKHSGWDEFFAKRSELFWKERRYTNVKVTIKLNPGAGDLHRNAVQAFTKKIVQEWDKRYEGIDWEIGYGKPKDFTASGNSFQGEISYVEISYLLKILIPKFMPLAKLLGDKLAEVTITSDTSEHRVEAKKVKREIGD